MLEFVWNPVYVFVDKVLTFFMQGNGGFRLSNMFESALIKNVQSILQMRGEASLEKQGKKITRIYALRFYEHR